MAVGRQGLAELSGGLGMGRRLGRALRLAPALMLGAAAPPPPATETWYRIVSSDGAAVGYVSQETRRTPEGRESIGRQVIDVEAGGSTSRIDEETRTLEGEDGRPKTISEHMRTGRSWSRVETRISGDRAEIIRTTASDRRKTIVALPRGVRFDGGTGLLRRWEPASAPLDFLNLNPNAMAVERVVIERVPARPGDPQGGYAAIRRRYEGNELRAVARLSIDPGGRVVAITQPMFGSSMTIALSDKETAHAPYRLLRAAMVKSPFRIPPSALRGRIRYRFAFRDGLSFPIPATREQNAAVSAEGAVLDICEGCGPGMAKDSATLADARKPTAWLQSDHPKLRAIARPVGRLKASEARKMELLIAKARPYLAGIDFVGHYSALETLNRKAGDCTEAAVLLAALGRAAGIPTRVASGLVYSRERYHGVSNVFMPHSWTLAFVDGEWRSFDLALDNFDATHIALTIGDGDARSVLAAGQLASLLEWQEMREVRARPGS
jgi:hypothetical protein